MRVTIKYVGRGLQATTECGRVYSSNSDSVASVISMMIDHFPRSTPVEVYWDAVSGNNPNTKVFDKPDTVGAWCDLLLKRSGRVAAA